MDPSFEQWLAKYNFCPEMLDALKKERVTNEMTLKAMKEPDLQSLRDKYTLQIGQVALLRRAGEELIRAEQESQSEGRKARKKLINDGEESDGDSRASESLLSPEDRQERDTVRDGKWGFRANMTTPLLNQNPRQNYKCCRCW